MGKLIWTAMALSMAFAQPAWATTFTLNYSGSITTQSLPTPSTTASPFSGFLTYEGQEDGSAVTTMGSALLHTDQYGDFNFTSYTASLSATAFTFSSTATPGLTFSLRRPSGQGDYTGTFSISSPPRLVANGTVSGSFQGVTGAVPEPASWLSLLLGFGGLGIVLRSAKRRSRSGGVDAPGRHRPSHA